MTDTRPSAEPTAEDWEEAIKAAKDKWSRMWDRSSCGIDVARCDGYSDAFEDIEREARRIARERAKEKT